MRVQAAIYVLLLMLAPSVTCIDKPLMTVPVLTAGEQTTLSCSAPDPCPSTHPNITWLLKKKGQNSSELSNSDYSQNYTHCNGTITSVLTFTPSAEQHDAEVVCVVSYGNVTTFNVTRNLTINYLKNATITGSTTVKKGETFNLTCSAESNSPVLISWSFKGSSASDENKTTENTLTITNVNSKHEGEYVCMVQNFYLTLKTSVNVTLMYQPTILNESTCFQLGKDLECSCLCKGVPLPHIVWPNQILRLHHHIEGRPKGPVMNSTIRIDTQEFPNNSMDCECENDAGKTISTLNINTSISIMPGKEEDKKVFKTNTGADTVIKLDVRTILTFLVGAASTAVILCLALCFVGICIRCGTVKAVDGNANKADVRLDAVKIQHNSAGTDQAEEDEHTPLRGHSAAAATNTAAVSREIKVEDTPGEERPSGEEEAAGEKEQKDVDYACIDYSLLEGRGVEASKAQSEEETEYAEIQIKKQSEEEGVEDLEGGEVQGEAQGLENEEQVLGEEEEIQV